MMDETKKRAPIYEDTNLPCGVIRDLLPNYMDGHVSEAGKAAIRCHLKDCGACRQELESMEAVEAVVEQVQEAQAEKRSAEMTAKVNAMKKVQRNLYLRRVGLVVLAIVLCGTVHISSIRSENSLWHGSDVHTGTVIQWENKTDRSAFTYQDTRYVRFDNELEDNFFDYSLTDAPEALTGKKETLTVRGAKGFKAWLFNENDYSSFYPVTGAGNCDMYMSDSFGPAYCKEGDLEAVKAYYDDAANYEFHVKEQEVLDDTVNVKLTDLKLSKAEHKQLMNWRKLPRKDILGSASEVELSFISKDGLLGVNILLRKDGGRWYMEYQASEKPSPSEDQEYWICCELPKSVSDKIETVVSKK